MIFLAKFHPELNPIESCWSQAKRYTKAYCNYTLPSLRNNITQSSKSITNENIKKKVREYMLAYQEGHIGDYELENKVKLYKSHRKKCLILKIT